MATLEPRSVDRANQELGVEAVEACASHCSDTIRRRLFWLTWPLLPSSQVDLVPISDERTRNRNIRLVSQNGQATVQKESL